MPDEVRPIIIRRKKVYAADGHHGGAWKVAYADFVTAMMAFFLLMWLLNATTEEQRKGIADYFNPNIPLAAVSGGGASALSGDTVFTQDTLAQNGTGAKTNATKAGETSNDKSEKNLEALNEALKSMDEELLTHVILKENSDGLVIELVDSDNEPLFSLGNASPSPLLKGLLEVVSGGLSGISNKVKIVGHTDARIFPNQARYSNWELSTDRANTARRLLVDYGITRGQVQEVSGKASTQPLSDDPMAAQNRRISITLLKSQGIEQNGVN